MKLSIHGACGRMGREVAAAVAATGDVTISSAVDVQTGADVGRIAVTDDLGAALRGCDVVLDFSTVEGTASLAAGLLEVPRPAVVAVTALPGPVLRALEKASELAPVMIASNLSVGAAVLRLVSARVAAALPEFDVEVIESHHGGKADAPSGTAVDIVAGIAAARGLVARECTVHGRGPGNGPRTRGTIGVHAVRGGTVAGEHEVMLLGQNERLAFRHSAESRSIFARGSIRAARWLVGRGPGLYRIDDMVRESLGL